MSGRITVHKHLNRAKRGLSCWSITQATKTDYRSNNPVYASEITLRDVKLYVVESSRLRVCRDGSREVHAWAAGVACNAPSGLTWREVTYNPHRSGHFHYRDGTAVNAAAFIHFAADGKAYAGR